MRQRLLHDWPLIMAVAAWLLASPWVSAARADAAQVTVVSPGGAQQTLSLGALGAGDVDSRSYALRSVEGESTVTLSGFSPAAILDAAGVDPFGFSYLEVQRPAGGSVLLSRDQALDSAVFPEGSPVIYATASGTGFLRPSTGADDFNAADSFEAPQGITLVLRNGSPLQVRAEASTLRTRPGKPVTFNAVVDRAGAGEQLAYSWYFDDGTSSTGPRTRHRFAKPGSYDVVVGVTTPGNDAGASAVVTVKVGPPLAGPDRKGGGTNENAGAPDHGAATGNGSAPSGAGGAADEDNNTAAPSPSSSPSCPQEVRRCEQQGEGRRKIGTSAAGEPVSGVLLNSEATPMPTPSVAARSGELSSGSGGPGLPGAALGLLATGALLGLGALTEARSLLR
jgi:PKD domain